jgi:hypothetical protein
VHQIIHKLLWLTLLIMLETATFLPPLPILDLPILLYQNRLSILLLQLQLLLAAL